MEIGERASPLDRKAPSACLSAQEHLRWSSGHFPLCSVGTRSTPSQTEPHCLKQKTSFSKEEKCQILDLQQTRTVIYNSI